MLEEKQGNVLPLTETGYPDRITVSRGQRATQTVSCDTQSSVIFPATSFRLTAQNTECSFYVARRGNQGLKIAYGNYFTKLYLIILVLCRTAHIAYTYNQNSSRDYC